MTEPVTDPPTDPSTDGDTRAERNGAPGTGPRRVVVVGPDGRPVGTISADALVEAEPVEDEDDDGERGVMELVQQPAKVMRIGSMIRQLLDEVKAAPLDEASRNRLKQIHRASIKELEDGLAPELVDELERLSLPFTEDTPSEGELRIAQAQLVGWLEGLFHGIQTAIYAQQVAARAQLEQMRRQLPPGMSMPGAQEHHEPGPHDGRPDPSSGLYL